MNGWNKIDYNPEVLTELLKNIKVKGVQIEEILSYDSLENSNIPIYGLIFIGKYIKNNSYTPNILQYWDKDLFFIKQITQNSSLTQTLIELILNNEEKIDMGPILLELKSSMREMDPLTKAIAFSNNEKIKNEHNKFKIDASNELNNNINNIDNEDAYHIVSFFHYKNSIYEMDGLLEGPILIENNVDFNEWSKKLKNTLTQRINIYSDNEIKFNLMALIPDKLDQLKKNKDLLITQKNYIEKKIEGNNDIKIENELKSLEEINGMNKEQLEEKLKKIESEINECNNGINIEKMKINKYKEENEKRQHNYVPLIFELLKIMDEKGILQEEYNKELYEQNNK
jgi:ubiquitin carboxyl-terminal hydrolase L5